MAILTKNLNLASAWQDATTALSLGPGTSWALDIRPGSLDDVALGIRAMVEWVLTDDAVAPAGITPHIWPSVSNPDAPYMPRQHNQTTGRYLWLRSTRPVVLVATETVSAWR